MVQKGDDEIQAVPATQLEMISGLFLALQGYHIDAMNSTLLFPVDQSDRL